MRPSASLLADCSSRASSEIIVEMCCGADTTFFCRTLASPGILPSASAKAISAVSPLASAFWGVPSDTTSSETRNRPSGIPARTLALASSRVSASTSISSRLNHGSLLSWSSVTGAERRSERSKIRLGDTNTRSRSVPAYLQMQQTDVIEGSGGGSTSAETGGIDSQNIENPQTHRSCASLHIVRPPSEMTIAPPTTLTPLDFSVLAVRRRDCAKAECKPPSLHLRIQLSPCHCRS